MIVHITDTIWAEGTPTESGIFLSTYLICLKAQYETTRGATEKQRILNETLASIRNIQIHEMKPKGEADGRTETPADES